MSNAEHPRGTRGEIERPEGLAQLHIHHSRFPLKTHLITVLGSMVVAVAWAMSGLWRQEMVVTYPPTRPAIHVVITVVRDIPVTVTQTATSTMAPWEKTTEAKVTARAGTRTPTTTIAPGLGGN